MWFWSCQGTAGGTYSFCSAPKVTGNTYTCQNNGNWSTAGASCDENTPSVNTLYGNTP
jgi:hypothetical protein